VADSSAGLLKPWHEVRPSVQVKLLPQNHELYVFAQSHARIEKKRAMRKRQLKRLWARLAKLATMKLSREALLMTRGAAQSQSPSAWRLVEVTLDEQIGADRNFKRAKRRSAQVFGRLEATDARRLSSRRNGSRENGH